MKPPPPDLERALLARNGSEGDEIRFRCPFPKNHTNGDAHPSARYHTKKWAWICDVCGGKGFWTDLCDLLGVTRPDEPEFAATYPYQDEDGQLLFEVVRKVPKKFVQRRPAGRGGWIWDLKGIRRVLFRLIAEDRLGLPPRAISLGPSSVDWPVELGNAVAAGGS